MEGSLKQRAGEYSYDRERTTVTMIVEKEYSGQELGVKKEIVI